MKLLPGRSRTVQLPDEASIVQLPAGAAVFGLNGDTPMWKSTGPGIEVALDRNLAVTGWVTRRQPGDNMWCATDSVLPSWQYRVRAFRQ